MEFLLPSGPMLMKTKKKNAKKQIETQNFENPIQQLCEAHKEQKLEELSLEKK